MINLSDALITDVLPYALGSSPEIKSVAYAINMACKGALMYMSKAMIYAGVDNLSDAALDILSAEFRAPYYDKELPIESKRAIIKNTIKWYFKAGTAYAVEGLVGEVIGNCDVYEWFDYEGDPYHFRVSVDITNDYVGPEEQETIRRIVLAYKNARSVLDEIEYRQVGTKAIAYCTAGAVGQEMIDSGVAENFGG